MEKISFECETITPMFLAGADGQTPELRAPSIKGALRFWWRALNGHLGLNKLKETEGELFGGTGDKKSNRSQLIIQVPFVENLKIDHGGKPVPHKGFMTQNAIETGEHFKICLMFMDKNQRETFRSLFILTCVLGGFGKRVRRGMGSVKILKEDEALFNMPQNLEGIHHYISELSKHFLLKPSGIYNNFSGRMELYPWVQSIEIGKTNHPNLVKHISQKTHDFKFDEDNKYSYEPSIGHAFRGRFASPIYVSALEANNELRPIITTLNTVPDRSHRNIDPVLQEEFKNSIL